MNHKKINKIKESIISLLWPEVCPFCQRYAQGQHLQRVQKEAGTTEGKSQGVCNVENRSVV